MRNASPLLVLAGLATSVVAEPIPRTAHHAMRTAAPTAAVARRQEGVPEDCTFFDIPTSEDQDCEYFAGLWGIPVEDFIAWVSNTSAFLSSPLNYPRRQADRLTPYHRTPLSETTAAASKLARSTA